MSLIPIEKLRHPKEKLYLFISLAISLLFYGLIGLIILGVLFKEPASIISMFFVFGFYFILFLIGHHLALAQIENNSVRVTEHNFPEINIAANHIFEKFGIYKPPHIFVMESGGFINAFAAKLMGKNVVVLYSEVVEILYQQNDPEVFHFILAHELSHIRLGHVNWLLFLALLPSMIIPFLGAAYSRACEFSCDHLATYLYPSQAINSMKVLLTGKTLYTKVNEGYLIKDGYQHYGFWRWLASILSSHPPIFKRLESISSIHSQHQLITE